MPIRLYTTADDRLDFASSREVERFAATHWLTRRPTTWRIVEVPTRDDVDHQLRRWRSGARLAQTTDPRGEEAWS